ncbi:MAG: DUF134 domain-containing protein [Oscillospiraceae bacterium]
MARPIKIRRVCRLPGNREFQPSGSDSGEIVILSVDEYEALRLVDLEGLTQEECAAQMAVSRPSVCMTLENARKKLADMLVNGKRLKIEGGPVTVCEHAEGCCGRCGSCPNASACERHCQKRRL